jgi:hypothetical protein
MSRIIPSRELVFGHLVRFLRRPFIKRRTVRQNDPRLRASRPDVYGRPQPRRIVQCPAEHGPDHPLAAPIRSQLAEQPCSTFRTCRESFATPALGYAVGDQPRLRTRQVECLRGYYDADGERAARETLAVRAVARVHAERLPRDLIADRSAHASAFQWQFHAPLPRRHPSPNPLQRPIAPSCGCRLLRPHQKTHFHRVTRRRSAATLRSYPSESPKLLHCALPAVCWLRLDEACTGAAVIRMLDLFS